MTIVMFLAFWLRKMCFAPQRRALLEHLNFQKWLEHVVLLTLLTSKCASRHNRVHFEHLNWQECSEPAVLWTCSLSNTCFAAHWGAIVHVSSGQMAPHPPLQQAHFSTLRSPKSLEKRSVSRLSYLFAHLHLLSSYSFSSTLLSSNLSLLSASSLLCFSSVHIVASLTSKLPSVL